MSDPVKVEPAAIAAAVALVVIALLAFAVAFQAAWNHGLSALFDGPQISYWAAFWSVVGLGIVGIVVKPSR